MKEIRNHVWYNIVKDIRVEGVFFSTHIVPIDHKVLNSLDEFGFNLDYAVKSLEKNKHNHVTTT